MAPWKKHFCRYCLQAFRTAEKFIVILKIALKFMVSKLLRCLRKVDISNSKILEERKSPSMIYADFRKHFSA